MLEYICKSYIYKELTSKIYKEFNSTATTIFKHREGASRHFSKDNIQMANRYMKTSSASLITMDIQVKTTMRYHPTPVRGVIIKKTIDKC